MDAIVEGLSKNLEELHELIREEEALTVNSVEDKQKSVKIIVIGTALVVLGISIAVSQLFKGTILRPLLDLTNSVEVIAGGDLTQMLNSNAKGEVGKLIASFNTMVDKLRNLISGVVETACVVAATSEQLSANSSAASKVTKQVTNAITEVAKGTSEQAEFITGIMARDGRY